MAQFGVIQHLSGRLGFVAMVLALSLSLLVTVAGLPVAAQTDDNAMRTDDPHRAFQLLAATPENQIPILGDRFRIDYRIDELTLVFFRDFNSDPVVLVLPDGSKWYESRHPGEQVRWQTGPDFDVIRIQDPMRGPWQISGSLRPESRALVMSDIELTAEPLPEVIFHGERLRIRAEFSEAGERIDQRDFRSVMTMDLFLLSANNADQDNYGLPPQEVGNFSDDGRGMDERPRDGVFTGEVQFNVPSGEYVPQYRARAPLYSRNYEQPSIMIRGTPVQVHVEVGLYEQEPHLLTIELDEDYLDMSDVVVQGQIEYPNGEIQRVNFSTKQNDRLWAEIPNYVYGGFQVELRVSATAVDGREFTADVPLYDFIARRPSARPPTEQELAEIRIQERREASQAEVQRELSEQKQKRRMIMYIVAGNVAVVVLWLLFMLLRMRRQKNKGKTKVKRRY